MPVLPNSDQAYIDPPKLHGYLLNRNHREGAGKAGFLASIGFDLTDPAAIAAALLAHGRTHAARRVLQGPFGEKYHIDGVIIAPIGQSANSGQYGTLIQVKPAPASSPLSRS